MLLDVQMPRVDGIAVLEKIKHDEHLRRMPVIMMSTSDDPRDIDRCYELGCNAYVQKPIAYREFAETVRCIAGFVKHLSLPSLHAVPGRLHE